MNQIQARHASEARRAPGTFSRKTRTRRAPQAAHDEEELVERLKDRDPEALKVIMRKYCGRLFAVANRISKNPADAEEVVQDVFVTAFAKIDRFEGRSTLATWLNPRHVALPYHGQHGADEAQKPATREQELGSYGRRLRSTRRERRRADLRRECEVPG